MIVFLDDPHIPKAAGPKARRLSELMHARFNVPRGFVVLPDSPGEGAELDQALDELQADQYAVRSSFVSEDGATLSFAGVFESVLRVPRSRVPQAIETVRQSANSLRARRYGDLAGLSLSPARMAVMVQEMVVADYYGVCLTEDPSEKTQMLISLASDPESVTSGEKSTTTTLSRAQDTDDSVLQVVREVALKIEKYFEAPQDIEFAIREQPAGFDVYILQSRPITS